MCAFRLNFNILSSSFWKHPYFDTNDEWFNNENIVLYEILSFWGHKGGGLPDYFKSFFSQKSGNPIIP